MLLGQNPCSDSIVPWEIYFTDVTRGLKGLLILWVFYQHTAIFNEQSYLHPTSLANRNNFNTAAFLIILGMITYSAERGKKIRYGSWVLTKWFGLIPLTLLSILMRYPTIYNAAQRDTEKPSTVLELYMVHGCDELAWPWLHWEQRFFQRRDEKP
jgi:hypothetical protein